MAIPITAKPNTVAPGGAYPYGNIRDNDGSGNGTPVNALVYADFHQFFAKLLDVGGVAANGLPENATNTFQYVTALNNLITIFINVEIAARNAAIAVETGNRVAADAGLQTQINDINTALAAIRHFDVTANTNSGGTATTIITIPRTANKTMRIDAKLVSVVVSGGDPAGSGSSAYLTAKYKDVAGTGTIIGAITTVDSDISAAAAAVLSFSVSGSNLLVTAQAGSGSVYKCRIVADVIEI